ncbi:MAG: hypothetical protein NWF08_04980 [Candidatus Bathyarchaeota archaeon]|nr:hypothetical protein [Candidatus Bathyarchaeota archaeon]
MAEATYTSNQAGAIAFLSANMMWGIAAYGIAKIFGHANPLVFSIMIIVALFLLPLYAKRVNLAYIVGIVLGIFAAIIFAVYPPLVGAPPWSEFTFTRFHVAYILLYLVLVALIYFSYRSMNETSTKATYTLNQTGTVATLFGIVVWALTFSWGYSAFGGIQELVLPIMTIIYLILLPFLIKSVKIAYITGMIIGIITMIWTLINPSLTGAPTWYESTAPVIVYNFVVYYIFTLAFIYFAYRSHAELEFSIIDLVKDLAG